MSRLICELVISLIKVLQSNGGEPQGPIFQVTTRQCCEAIDRKLMGAFMDNRLGWEAFLGSRASSLFALVRACKDSSGLREFGFGHRISLLCCACIDTRDSA